MSTIQTEITHSSSEYKGFISLCMRLTKRVWFMPLAMLAAFLLLVIAGSVRILPPEVVNNILEYVKALIPR